MRHTYLSALLFCCLFLGPFPHLLFQAFDAIINLKFFDVLLIALNSICSQLSFYTFHHFSKFQHLSSHNHLINCMTSAPLIPFLSYVSQPLNFVMHTFNKFKLLSLFTAFTILWDHISCQMAILNTTCTKIYCINFLISFSTKRDKEFPVVIIVCFVITLLHCYIQLIGNHLVI